MIILILAGCLLVCCVGITMFGVVHVIDGDLGYGAILVLVGVALAILTSGIAGILSG